MKEQLEKLEQQMREHAIAIKSLYEIADNIDGKASKKMVEGVKEYIDYILENHKDN